MVGLPTNGRYTDLGGSPVDSRNPGILVPRQFACPQAVLDYKKKSFFLSKKNHLFLQEFKIFKNSFVKLVSFVKGI